MAGGASTACDVWECKSAGVARIFYNASSMIPVSEMPVIGPSRRYIRRNRTRLAPKPELPADVDPAGVGTSGFRPSPDNSPFSSALCLYSAN